jgi:phage shock protein PspC (stress-responsive transcriptional regulator)
MTKLYRSESDRMLGGVCGGIAEVYDMDPTLVRLLVVLISLSGIGSPLLAYLIAWIIIPSESEVKNKKVKDVKAEKVEDEE